MLNEPNLQFIINLTLQAGSILMARFGNEHQIDYKGRINLVTEVDQESEDYILKTISDNYPDHKIVSEESGSNQKTSRYCWYVDPLDGTVNYAHGIPIFAVTIALAIDGVVRYGVIYDPTRDELFVAEKGKGATLNGAPIQVNPVNELIDSLVATGFPYNIATTERNNLKNNENFAFLTHGVRRLGCAALDLAYTACGRVDGYWELDLFPWDIAAGALIVQEAGGITSNTEGGQPLMTDTHASILASNPILHQKMLSVLQN